MNVMIPGMEMPEDCAKCQLLEGDRMDGLCHGAKKWLDDEHLLWCWFIDEGIDDSKPINCPLIAVPDNTLFIVRDGILYEQKVKTPESNCIVLPPIEFKEDKS